MFTIRIEQLHSDKLQQHTYSRLMSSLKNPIVITSLSDVQKLPQLNLTLSKLTFLNGEKIAPGIAIKFNVWNLLCSSLWNSSAVCRRLGENNSNSTLRIKTHLIFSELWIKINLFTQTRADKTTLNFASFCDRNNLQSYNSRYKATTPDTSRNSNSMQEIEIYFQPWGGEAIFNPWHRSNFKQLKSEELSNQRGKIGD